MNELLSTLTVLCQAGNEGDPSPFNRGSSAVAGSRRAAGSGMAGTSALLGSSRPVGTPEALDAKRGGGIAGALSNMRSSSRVSV